MIRLPSASPSLYGSVVLMCFQGLREMQFSFQQVNLPVEQDRLVAFLLREPWPFHVNTNLAQNKVQEMIAEGHFTGSNHECFWILDASGREIGFIRLIDLDDIGDGYPLFDLRLCGSERGKGIGKEALKWLTKYMFTKWPNLDRIAGTTRVDNTPMRKTFRACGYVKEGHYRKDWGSSTGKFYDTVKYGILREDWETGRTTPVNWNDEA
jgi:RimJ/RimL family protein N-acetyltransferase